MTNQPKYSMWQIVRASLAASMLAIEEVRALARKPGPKGDRGEVGAPGRLPVVKVWKDKIYYEGEVVIHGGGTYQARCDTAKPPGHLDWIVLATPGVDGHDGCDGIDGRGFTIRDTYDPNEKNYSALDIVTLNSTWFIARCDNPGPCPGDGWKSGPVGKRGDKGERGERGAGGAKGDVGANGREWVGWDIDRKNYTVTPIMSDGSVAPTLYLRELFEQFQSEAM